MATYESAVEAVEDRPHITHSTDELPLQVWECLIDKSLCTLISMNMKNRLPKTKSKLANSLRPCTVIAPYVSPLDALRAANKLPSTRTPRMNIPHAKKRVYATLTMLKEARMERMNSLFTVRAPFNSEAEKSIVDDIVAWLRSDPEGSEELLVCELLNRCEGGTCEAGDATSPRTDIDKLFHKMLLCFSNNESQIKDGTISYSVYPAQLFSRKNLKRIKHRRVKAEEQSDVSAPGKHSQQTNSEKTNLSMSRRTSGPVEPKVGLEIAIGVRPGENSVREQIDLTPEGLAGIEVSVSGSIPADPPKRTAKTSPKSSDERSRAVGQCKGLYGFFISRLTKATHNDRAVLVAANEQEKKDMIAEVAEWVNSFHGSSAGDHPETAAAAVSAHSAGESMLQTVPRLQQELVNRCVGKARHITPFTLTDMLEASGYITVSDDQMVTYNLPKDRGSCVSWQQKTVEVAATSCKWSSLVKKAFPRRKMKSICGNWAVSGNVCYYIGPIVLDLDNPLLNPYAHIEDFDYESLIDFSNFSSYYG